MRRMAVALIAFVLVATGCSWFVVSIDGDWTGIGETQMMMGETLVTFTSLSATFDSGAYDFRYTIRVDGDGEPESFLNSHSGTVSPSNPSVDQTMTFTVSSSSGDKAPPVGTSFAGKLLYLDRKVMVLEIVAGEDGPVLNWAFERQ